MNTHLERLNAAADAGELAARFGANASSCPYPITSEQASHWLRAFDAELIASLRLARIRSGSHYSFMEAAE